MVVVMMRKYKPTKPKVGQLATTVVAISLLCFGVANLTWPHVHAALQRHEGAVHNVATLKKVSQGASQPLTMRLGTPTHLSLPRLGISIAVDKGVYSADAQTWTIDSHHAFWMQAPSGQTATPIIYGHDISPVFGHLAGVAQDEILQVVNIQGQTLLFRYVGDQTLAPTDAGIMGVHYANAVILITCSGAQYQYRRALKFAYVGIQDVPLTVPGSAL